MTRVPQSDLLLKLTHDRKVSPRGLPQESRNRMIPTVANSFGLPAGDSCPGRTPFCTSCYAERSEQSAGVRALVEHNLRMLNEAGGIDGMVTLLTEAVGRFWREAATKGLAPGERIFRIHWDGDFFSEDYAWAWRRTMASFRQIQFWAYTRSFTDALDVVPVLAPVPNLSLYLSVDAWNVDAARRVRERYPDVRWALCAEDYSRARALDPEPSQSALICPENALRMPLMDDEGRGACVTCAVCPSARRDILFAVTHTADVAVAAPKRPYRPRVPAQPPEPRICRRPSCSTVIQPTGKPGRPPQYCSRPCQLADWRARKQERAAQAAEQLAEAVRQWSGRRWVKDEEAVEAALEVYDIAKARQA